MNAPKPGAKSSAGTAKDSSAAETPAAIGEVQGSRAPTYRPESAPSVTPDLFALVDVATEHSLGQRLLQHGADLYCAGEFASFTERLRHVILRERLATAICGRDNADRVETYEAAFLRVTGEPLVAKVKGSR